MTPQWSVTLHPDPPGIHTWNTWCGLALLHEREVIALRVADTGAPIGPGAWLSVNDHVSGAAVTVHVDTSDGPTVWSPVRAAAADVVWKRSAVSSDHMPLGLVSGMRAGTERRIAYALAAARSAWGRRDGRRLAAALGGLVRAKDQPLVSSLSSDETGEPVVLFQTRAWRPEGGGDPGDRQRVNDERATLIRALREDLGPRFRGGFTDEPDARAVHPDLISDLPHDRHGFLRLLPRHAVAISTVGLHGSNPWKLVEYLASGRAIVSEPLRYTVPESLDGVARWFTSPDECVAACRSLLDDTELRREAQAAAREYWTTFVRPDELLHRRLLETTRL